MDDLISPSDAAKLFGIAPHSFGVRVRANPTHPKDQLHPVFGRPAYSVSAMQEWSKQYHAFYRSKSLFSNDRLAELSPEEIEAWGVAHQHQERVAK